MNQIARSTSEHCHIANCLDLCRQAIPILENITLEIKNSLINILNQRGGVTPANVEKEQFLTHGFAWIATYVESLNQLLSWADRLHSANKLKAAEGLILQIAFGEYIGQIQGGIQMSQSEIIRIDHFNLSAKIKNAFHEAPIRTLIKSGNTDQARKKLVECIHQTIGQPNYCETGLDSEYESIRDTFFRFSTEKILPNAHKWHLNNELIPMALVEELSDLGVFVLTIPEYFGGLGMKKMAMCLVSEELARAYIGVGSLATRSEIAAELILRSGTKSQKEYWLPGIASGQSLPAAVFTEPNFG